MENKNKVSLKSVFTDGVLTSNPLFVSLLGLCPALAITDKFMNAIGMTFAFFFVLLLSNVVISLLRNLIPDEIRIPVYIIIVATFVTCVALLMEAFTPELYSTLSTFINLIVVNCIILGRAEAFASKNTVGASAMDAVGQSLGYGLGLLVIALIREVLGTQSLTFSNPFNAAQSVTIPLLTNFKIELFNSSAGAFITLAIVLAVIAAIQNAVNSKKKGEK
jgi:electron transport complex protein RnfE